LDGILLVVGNLNHRLGRTAVDELDAEDIGVGEAGSDVGTKFRTVTRAASVGVERLRSDVH
jgi:hypothetical protein